MHSHEQITAAIALLRGVMYDLGPENEADGASGIIIEVFSNGNCGNLAFALKELIPGSHVLYSRELTHYWLMFDGEHYDISGRNAEHFKALHEDGLAVEVFLAGLSPSELNNYSFATRGPII
jgi:hypothetical protein